MGLYLPMRCGFLYPAAVVGRASVSNATEAESCLEALEGALARFGRPEIPDADRGSQSTPPRSTDILQRAGVRPSVDGRGRRMGDIAIERPWRGLAHGCVCPHASETGSAPRAGPSKRTGRYDVGRPRSSPRGGPPRRRSGGARWREPDGDQDRA